MTVVHLAAIPDEKRSWLEWRLRRIWPRRGALVVGLGAAAIALMLSVGFGLASSTRVDYFYLADAFLHGRTWLAPAPWLGPQDIVPIGSRVYLPFGPMPAILLMPLVALLGPAIAASAHSLVDALVFGGCAGLAWILASRFDEGRTSARVWVVSLFSFSTPLLSMAALGGVWYTAQLVAVLLTLLLLLEATGSRRPWLMGLLVGAAFLTRGPLLFAAPFAIAAAVFPLGLRDPGAIRASIGRAAGVLVGLAPALALFAWYNTARFGSALDSGYAAATLTEPLFIAARAAGLFSLSHLPPNLVLLLVRGPYFFPPPIFIATDGIGLSLVITTPAVFFAWRARFRDPWVTGCALTALLILVPNLLYYGGGANQIGFRYLLDSWPFLLVVLASASSRNGMPRGWKMFVCFGIVVNVWLITSLAMLIVAAPG